MDWVPVHLLSSNKNWGPKLFRFINGWLEHKEEKLFIENLWQSFKVEGWTTCVVKEKLKMLNEKLNVWNKEVYGFTDLKIEEIVKEMNLLESLSHNDKVSNGDRIKCLNTDFWRVLHAKESLLAQKARTKWFK